MKKFFQPFATLLMLTVLITTGQGCFKGSTAASQEKVELEYWRVFDDEDSMKDIITAYRSTHPNVKINYKKLRFDEYESELLRALAEGRGPDILSIHNTWLPAYQNLLLPMPDSVTVTEQETQGTLRKEVVVVNKVKPTMSIRELKANFVEQVPKDVILPYQPDPDIAATDKIYGFPLSVDSMALFYNKDLLSAAGIATPPTDWTVFISDVEKLTQYDDQGNIKQSGAAIGSAKNVERASDILSLLMIQNGTQMTDDQGRIAFHLIPDETPADVFPGLDAVEFYTDFSDPTKKAYTWNDSMPTSFEAFAAGKTAFFFGYSYHIPLIRTAAPKLNFAISGMPQIVGGKTANFANYWVESVSKDTKNPDWAWDFLTFATSQEQVSSYLTAANKPTALRNLINTQLENEDLSAFATQVLTAESWYHGMDVAATDEALQDLIDGIATNPEKPEKVIVDSAKKVMQTY